VDAATRVVLRLSSLAPTPFAIPDSRAGEVLSWWSEIPFVRSRDSDIDGWMQGYRESLAKLLKLTGSTEQDFGRKSHTGSAPDVTWHSFEATIHRLDQYVVLDEDERVRQLERLKLEAGLSAATLEELIDEPERV
jgi:hypothetical protein